MEEKEKPKGITSLIYYECPLCGKVGETQKCPDCLVLGLSKRS
jgi:hypothetical protein